MPAGPDRPDAHTPAGWTALGASVQFVVTDPQRLERGRAMLANELAAIDAACNRLRPGSELARLAGNPHRDTGPVRVGPLLAEAIAAALRTAQLTDGDIDPTVGEYSGPDRFPPEVAGEPELAAFLKRDPGWRQVRLDARARLLWLPPRTHLDLSATARAWAVDRCAGRLAGTLGCGVLVGLGGDIAVAGQVPAGGWRIRVQDVAPLPVREPRPKAGPARPAGSASTVVAIHDGGLSTSSRSARRWRVDPLHYILDPRGGMPAAPFWRTVSVAAATCMFASAASAAAMIRGRHAKEWLASLRLPARLVALDGRVHTVAGWPAAAA
jgi:thiamine biosynthesis lipoprotein ApbE